MEAIWPSNSPEGLAFTPAFKLEPGCQLIFLGLVTPERGGIVSSSIVQQAKDCLTNMNDALEVLKCSAKIIKTRRFMTDIREVWATQHEFEKVFGTNLPTSTLLEVHSCSHPDARMEIEAWAMTESDQTIQQISTTPFFPSNTVANKDLQVVMLSVTSGKPSHSLFVDMTTCMNSANSSITTWGGSSKDVLKIALYLKDMRLLEECLNILRRNYAENPPAIVPIAVNKLEKQGARIELEFTYSVPRGKFSGNVNLSTNLTKRQMVFSGAAAIPIYSYKKAHEAYSYKPEQSPAAQTRISLANYENVLKAAGRSSRDIFRTTWYLSDIREWPQVEAVAKEYFQGPVPNPSVIEISKLVLPGVRVEVDMWAAYD